MSTINYPKLKNNEIKIVFNTIDVNSDGNISANELKEVIKNNSMKWCGVSCISFFYFNYWLNKIICFMKLLNWILFSEYCTFWSLIESFAWIWYWSVGGTIIFGFTTFGTLRKRVVKEFAGLAIKYWTFSAPIFQNYTSTPFHFTIFIFFLL